MNKLILIGNGFDLAHGLKTSYKDFLDWYMCKAFQEFYNGNDYSDSLIEISNKFPSTKSIFEIAPKTFIEVLDLIKSNNNQAIKYKSIFFNRIIGSFTGNNWVDIERYYFRMLKSHFLNNSTRNKREVISKLNTEFDFLIEQLVEYIGIVNTTILQIPPLAIDGSKTNFNKMLSSNGFNIKVLNFNYTETLNYKKYQNMDDVIYMHGRVEELDANPLIFGYGDETDPTYQNIEDSGENFYLEHIKSFGYFKTSNYHNLLSYIDSAQYLVYIVGHSCGLSDRVLLNTIFEHQNCLKIEIFYHRRDDGTDNFKEITQEISRHFKPQNKGIMRRRISDKNIMNIIPQNSY